MSTEARPSEGRLRTWRTFLQSHGAIVDRLEYELQRYHNLSLPSYEVLLHLSEAPDGRLRMQELVGCALMTKSGVSRLVDRLEAEGLLSRVSCPSDRRGAYAVLTPEGRRRLRRAAVTHLRGVQEHFAGQLDDGEAAVLDSALGRILESLPRRGRLPSSCDGSAGAPSGATPPRLAASLSADRPGGPAGHPDGDGVGARARS